MSGEIVPVPGTSFLQEMQLAGGEQLKTTFVGGIRYNRGRKLTLLGDQAGRLVTSNINLTERADLGLAVANTSRMVTLDTFPTVHVRQVDLAEVDFRKPRTVHKIPPLSMHFDVTNPSDGQTERLVVDDSDIYKVFTGDKGGLVVFSGKGLPEETGLLFERETQDGHHALILFMHPPDDGELKFDSVTGLQQFTDQLITVFAADEGLELQKETLEALRRTIRKNRLGFDPNGARQQLFTLQLISLARLIQGDDQNHDKSEIKKPLSEFRRGPLRRLGRLLHLEPDFQARADEQLDGMIIDFYHPLPTEIAGQKALESAAKAERKRQRAIEAKQEEEEFITSYAERLTTPRALALWRNTTAEDYEYDNENTRHFLYTIVDMIGTANTTEEIDDIQVLLAGLFSSKYRKVELDYELDLSKKKLEKRLVIYDEELDEEYDEDNLVSVTVLRTQLEDAAVLRRQNIQPTSSDSNESTT